MNQLALLRQIVAAITRIPHKPGPIRIQDQVGLARGKFNFRELELVGLPAAGMRSVRDLSRLLRKDDPKLEHTASSAKTADAIFDLVLELFVDTVAANITAGHLKMLRDRLSQWATGHDFTRLHIVPCFIAPRDCGDIRIGPVHFFHASHFQERRAIWETAHQIESDEMYGSFVRDMEKFGAHYIAEVNVCGREDDRSRELADLAVDLALSGLQLVIPLSESRNFSRMSGRCWSVLRSDLVFSRSGLSGGGWNRSPGLTLGSDIFQLAISRASRLLGSVGDRINVFLGNQESTLPKLEQAWCDAAYWMHEGFAEAIGAITIAKLETSLEVLMSAGSTKMNRARLRMALKVFNGRDPDQSLFLDSATTVDAFVEEVVATRSRVLHGTLPTLTHEAGELSYAIPSVVQDHVLKFTLALDQYTKQSDATDDVKCFLTWLKNQRAWEWSWT